MEHEMGITVKKADNFSEWYTQMLTKGKFIEYYDISGCYVLLPNSFSIWEHIQSSLDKEFKKIGIKNAYFPLFISEANLEKETNHLEGFAPEVAWVTKGGNSNLAEKIAIRPTSECAIYPIVSRLIKSHNDLPLKMNQWCNVVRWEFKDCTPFLRSKEFLWQEIHICHDTFMNAQNEALKILDLYKDTYNKLLACPVIKGKKTEGEKFAGADSTYTIETFIPVSGKGIQAATSHNLGQNFSKMFDITFQDTDTTQKYVYQISCGFTTRSIGIMLMLHGDDKGAIIPPFVADIQIVIVPIVNKHRSNDILQKCDEVYKELSNNFRVKIDNSNHSPGWKYNYWETLGVPLRIEIGPKDVDKNMITVCKRNTHQKYIIENKQLCQNIGKYLEEIQKELYTKAYNEMIAHIKTPSDKEEFDLELKNKNLCLIKWCESEICETYIKEKTKAKPLCIPLDLDREVSGNKCCICGSDAERTILFGKSY